MRLKDKLRRMLSLALALMLALPLGAMAEAANALDAAADVEAADEFLWEGEEGASDPASDATEEGAAVPDLPNPDESGEFADEEIAPGEANPGEVAPSQDESNEPVDGEPAPDAANPEEGKPNPEPCEGEDSADSAEPGLDSTEGIAVDSEGEATEEGEGIEAHPLFASEAAELRFAESPVKIGKGERYTPALIGLPEGAQGVSYKSSKPKIFSVNPDTGEIEGLKTGKGKLTVTYGPSSASVTVQVCAAPKSFRLDPAELELGVGEFAAPKVVPSPKSAYGHVKSWRSGDEAVAAVEDGKLRAVAPGETDVTAVLYNDLECACKVTVREAPSAEGMALALPVGCEDGVIGVGQTVQLGVRYENAAGSVEFRSESEAVATVDASGKLKGIAPGKAVIVARAYNGVEASLEITVKAKPTKLALANAPKTLGVGEPWTLEVKLSNKAGDDCGGAVKFSSSKPGVLDVDPHTGALTAKKTGSAKITATTYNKLKKSATIAVKQAPTGFALSASELEIGMGQKGAKLTVTYAGKKQFGNVRWENENPDVVALSAKGALTPLAPGSSRITATVYNSAAPDEPFVQICDVTVKQKPEKGGVRLVFLDSEGKERSTIGVGESIAPSIVCANGGGGGFTLSSSKKSVATASKSGVVKGKKKGKAKITAKTYNNVKASATMQVVPGPALVRYTYYPGNPMPKGTRYKLRVMMVDKDYNELERMSHTFESSNPDIVSVDPVTGVLTAVSDSGNAKITARAYNGVEAVIYVFATKAPDEGEGGGSTVNPTIQMTQSELTLKPGETAELDVKTTGLSYLTGADVYWASDDSSVATVSWGHVKAVGPGTTRITASVEGPSGPLTAVCQVTVTDASGNTPTPGATTPEPGGNTPEHGSSTEPGPGGDTKPSISLNQTSLELNPGDAAQLTPILTGLPGKSAADVSWKSGDSAIATVSGGLVEAVGPGSTRITASVKGPSDALTATCQVTVSAGGEATGFYLRLNKSSMVLGLGQRGSIQAIAGGVPGASASNVSWSSSNEAVATVSGGTVSAQAVGSCTIMASLKNPRDDAEELHAACTVMVVEEGGEGVTPAIVLENTNMTVKKYSLTRIPVKLVSIPGCTVSDLDWTSGDKSVAEIKDGVWLRALDAGTVKLVAKLSPAPEGYEDVSAELTVTVQKKEVTDRPGRIVLDDVELFVEVGQKEYTTVGSMVIPDGVGSFSFESITWSCSDSTIATLDREKGSSFGVSGLKPGKCVVTGTAANPTTGKVFATETCSVTVVPKKTPQIFLNRSQLYMVKGESADLFATTLDCDPGTLSWYSSTSSVASVVDGHLTALKSGKTTIRASASYKPYVGATPLSCFAVCEVTVFDQPAELLMDVDSLHLVEGGTAQLKPTLRNFPKYTVQDFTWKSSDEAVATVRDGLVTAQGAGSAVITASVINPMKPTEKLSAQCNVEVDAWGGYSVWLNKTSLALVTAQKEQLQLKLRKVPDLSESDFTWSSSASDVASVSSKGLVTALAPGETTIRVSYNYMGNDIAAECSVTVRQAESAVLLSDSELSLVEGRNWQLYAQLQDMPGVEQIRWATSERSVATVTGGKIVAVAPGEARITASASYANVTYSAECSVTVTAADYAIRLNPAELNMYVGDRADIGVELVNMPDASVEDVTWKSGYSYMLTVDAGHVVAKDEGSTEITASISYMGRTVSAVCPVTVEEAPPSLHMSADEASLYVGNSLMLSATKRDISSSATVSWKSDAPGIATVDDGLVHGVAPGTATITATATDEDYDGVVTTYTATCKINVEKYPAQIWLNPPKLDLVVGEQATVVASLIGMPASTPVRWSSGAGSVASVEGGVVTARSAGTAQITASATDPDGGAEVTAICEVTVEDEVKLMLSPQTLRLRRGEQDELSAYYTGDAADAPVQNLRWEIDNSSVASVEGGLVSGKELGRARIIARADHPTDPGRTLTAECALVVLERWDAATQMDSAQLQPQEGRVEAKWELSGADYYGVYEIVDGVEILRGVVSDGDISLYGVAGGTHTYVVRPREYNGTEWVEGEASAPITVEVEGWRTPTKIGTAASPEMGRAQLSWGAVPGADAYIIYEVLEDDLLRQVARTAKTSLTFDVNHAGWHNYSVAAVVRGEQGNLSMPAGLCVTGGIKFESEKVVIRVGDEVQLIPTMYVEDGLDRTLTWTSSNEDTVLVDEDGWLTGVHELDFDHGYVTVTASLPCGYSATCQVKVQPYSWKEGDYDIEDGVIVKYNGFDENPQLPTGVRGIADEAFEEPAPDCASNPRKRNVYIPDGVEFIGGGAFYNSLSMESIRIPDSVKKLGTSVFDGCLWTPAITLPEGLKEIPAGTFSECWSITNMHIPEGVEKIGSKAFYWCRSLQNVNIPDGVKSIGSGAFTWCWALEGITIPAGVTEIPSSTFAGCDAMRNVTIKGKITRIGDYAFSGCDVLGSIDLSEGLLEIGEKAFDGDKSLRGITIPDSVTSIGESAFSGCESLTSIRVPGNASLGSNIFYGCTGLRDAVFEEGTKKIPERTFEGCTSLESVELPDGLTSIRDGAFAGCTSLKTLRIPDSVNYIYKYRTDVFDPGTTLICSAGSYAESWAKENGQPYTVEGATASNGEFTIGTGMKLSLKDLLGSVSSTQGYWVEDPEIADFDNNYDLIGIRPGTVQVADVMRRNIYTVHVIGFPEPRVQLAQTGKIQQLAEGITGEWSSSDPSIAFVDQEGVVTGYRYGEATITCRRDEDFYISYVVEVSAAAGEIFTDPAFLLLAPGETGAIKLKTSSGSSAGASFMSNKEEIATVDEQGTVLAKKSGRARITAQKLDDPGVSAVCDVVVLRETDGARALGQIEDIKAAAKLLMNAHATFDGGYTNSMGDHIEVDLEGVSKAAMAVYQSLKGNSLDPLGWTDTTNAMYLAEKIMGQHVDFSSGDIMGKFKTYSQTFFKAFGFTKKVENTLVQFTTENMKQFTAMWTGKGQPFTANDFQSWFKKNGETTGLYDAFDDFGMAVSAATMFLTIMEGFCKLLSYSTVPREEVEPIIRELRGSGVSTLVLAGGILDQMSSGPAMLSIYLSATIGAKEAEKQLLKKLNTMVTTQLTQIPTVGFFFAGAMIGKDIGFVVSDFLFNADGIATAAFDLEKSVFAARDYLRIFKGNYQNFLENPASLERLLAFHDSLMLFSSLVRAEYSEFETYVTKYGSSIMTKIEGKFTDARKIADQEIATLKELGAFYANSTLERLTDFRRNCDGKGF